MEFIILGLMMMGMHLQKKILLIKKIKENFWEMNMQSQKNIKYFLFIVLLLKEMNILYYGETLILKEKINIQITYKEENYFVWKRLI